MTITTEPSPLSYNGNGSTTEFSITWKYFAKSDVVATLRDSNGAETTWTLDTDYTLTAAGVDSGGALTATTAPASGETLVISLDPPNTQDSSLPAGGALPSSTVEDELDQAAQRDAKIETLFDRCLRVPKTDLRTGTDLELPIDTSRASKYLKFDGNGVPTAAAGTATLGETGLLSQDTESELTISSGSVTPTVATHSVDTESDASSDNLDNIVTTNLEDGRLLLIRGNNSARTVTIRDQQGGAGQIHTSSGNNVALSDVSYMLLQRRGADWYEVKLVGGDIVADTTPQLGGNLDVNDKDITNASGDITVLPVSTAAFVVKGNSSQAGRIRLNEDTDNGTNYMGLVAPAAVTASTDLVLPDGDGTAGQSMYTNGSGTLAWAGSILQVVETQTGAVATGTTNIPIDDTIPQNTEGDEYMTLAITPKLSTSQLIIDVTFNFSMGAAAAVTIALFQDSTADALATVIHHVSGVNFRNCVTFRHIMTSGTTSSTTFKVRAGEAGSNTVTFNGASGSREFGGNLASRITITEVAS